MMTAVLVQLEGHAGHPGAGEGASCYSGPPSSATSWIHATTPRFPPRARRALHRTVLDEILEERVVSGRGRQVPRGVKRKMSSYPLRPRAPQPTIRVDFNAAIRIAK